MNATHEPSSRTLPGGTAVRSLLTNRNRNSTGLRRVVLCTALLVCLQLVAFPLPASAQPLVPWAACDGATVDLVVAGELRVGQPTDVSVTLSTDCRTRAVSWVLQLGTQFGGGTQISASNPFAQSTVFTVTPTSAGIGDLMAVAAYSARPEEPGNPWHPRIDTSSVAFVAIEGFGATCMGIPVTADLRNGGVPTNGDDVILGTPGDDTIDGLGGNDIICGGRGDDTIKGGPGDDLISGGLDNDRMHGGPGSDYLLGGLGSDTIVGDSGDDRLRGGRGSDNLFGGAGNDSLLGNTGFDRLFGGPGTDVIDGGNGPDVLDGGAGADSLTGGSGDDRCVVDSRLDASPNSCERVRSSLPVS